MIPRLKKILYATDLSKNSAHAYQYAANLAEKYGAQIHIIHILEKIPANAKSMLEIYLTDDLKKSMENRNEEVIEKIKKRVDIFCNKFQRDNPQCTLRVASIDVYEGYPVEEILKKSSELNCDIIIMGTHGKGFIMHAFLGSVAEKIFRNSKKPVLGIPLPEDESEFTVHDF